MMETIRTIHSINIDNELSKADRSIYIMIQYKKGEDENMMLY